MTARRIALIYDDRPRPETTGTYCLRALRELTEVEHFRPGDWDAIPRSGFDLYVNVDDGHEYRLPPDLRPSAWWVIDTHMNLEWDLKKAPDFDLVFAAQRPGAEALRAAGVAAEWLPLACDPAVHARHDLPTEYDVCFVGNVVRGPRAELLALLRANFPWMLVDRLYFEAMARAYSASKIAFNRSVGDDVNMRVFETLACGPLLLTNDLAGSGQDELFRDGVHLATYRDADELLDKARFYLAREGVRLKVAAAGRAEALAKHTYRHRMVRLLDAAGRRAGREVAAVPDAPPADAAAGGATDARDAVYFDFARPELLALIPETARDVLDVGCGAGRLGAAVKARQDARVTGVEYDPAAARTARTRLDRVLEGDVETLEPDWGPAAFDAVVCGDVLEHLREPGAALRKIRGWLRPGGTLVVSVPNVRHHSVLRGLLAGHWTYQAAGLLDRTHLRFFTRRELEKLLFRAGFRVESLGFVPGAEHADWVAAGRPGEVRVGPLGVAGLHPADAEEFHAYQFLATAAPVPRPDDGLTSIVVVTHNRCEDTRRCVESLRLVTDEPHELIVVDNGSADGTPDFLRALGGVRAILNPDNRGFPAAANQGIRAAKGRQILLLNPDTVLTTGWLRRLLDALRSAPDIGLAGPCTDRANGRQRVARPYDPEFLDGFAWDWAAAHAGQVEDVDTLSGFCLLARRAVFDEVGLLDERFGLGCLEDDDLCLRARRAGFRCVVARDAFVRHLGHRSFRAAGVDQDAYYQRNLALFRQKWAAEGGPPDPGLTSIVVVTHDQLEFTRGCVASVRRATAEPYEFVLVDNGSTDGTPDYLRSVPDATVVLNPENRGFPAAANQGLRAAKGRQVVLLNNDTVVPAGWLGRLLRPLAENPRVGLVGPCSNEVSGEQRVAAGYGDLEGLEEFAARHAAANGGVREPTDRLVGFCLLIRREVIDRVGLLDERFGPGCFEDDDYCRRALAAGWAAVVARDAYVHHYGGVTFRASGIDFGRLMRDNGERFRLKWGGAAGGPAAAPAGGPAFATRTGNGPGLYLERGEVVLSLCMIVRDNARTITAALEGVRPWVDEMVVVDTGSRDDTPAVCDRLGARVSRFAWVDDFAAARNESLRRARGRWRFWMDSDDVIDPDCGRRLRDLACGGHDPAVLGYVVKVRCPGPRDADDVTVVDHVKLVRNHPDIRFEGRIHEQVLPSIRRLGGEVAWTDLFVTHAGYDHSPAGQAGKLERDLRLLHLDLAERPDHPFVLFNLGMTYADAGRYGDAAGFLRQSIAAAAPGESHLRKAYALLASCHERLPNWGAAWAACAEGLHHFPLDAELRFRKAILLHRRGRLREAAAAYEDLLQRRDERHFTSAVEGIDGRLARHNLALVYDELGDWDRAESQWRAALVETPGYPPALSGLREIGRKRGSPVAHRR